MGFRKEDTYKPSLFTVRYTNWTYAGAASRNCLAGHMRYFNVVCQDTKEIILHFLSLRAGTTGDQLPTIRGVYHHIVSLGILSLHVLFFFIVFGNA